MLSLYTAGTERMDRQKRPMTLGWFFKINDAGHEDPLYPFFDEVKDVAVGKFDGKTCFDNNIFHTVADSLLVCHIGKTD